MTTAVYAGSFDPITRGHLSVIERAAGMFDTLHVVVAVHPTKEPLFDKAERVALVRASSVPDNVTVASTPGYIVEYARSVGARYLVRGVRGRTDIDDEMALAVLNAQLAPDVETVFVPAIASLADVSSSALKDLARSGEDLGRWCSDPVAAALRARLGGPSLGALR